MRRAKRLLAFLDDCIELLEELPNFAIRGESLHVELQLGREAFHANVDAADHDPQYLAQVREVHHGSLVVRPSTNEKLHKLFERQFFARLL